MSDSKYMEQYVAKENRRIQSEISEALYKALSKAGFVITVSRDSENRTERGAASKNAFVRMVTDQEWGPNAWVFCYPNGTANTKKAHAAGWVHLNTFNDGIDFICDYTTSLTATIAPALAVAKKYE